MKKHKTIALSPKIKEMLTNGDVLTMDVTAFNHGGSVNGEKAIPFVELTPELFGLLSEREQAQEQKSLHLDKTCTCTECLLTRTCERLTMSSARLRRELEATRELILAVKAMRKANLHVNRHVRDVYDALDKLEAGSRKERDS